MRMLILFTLFIVPIFFGQPEGFKSVGAWCTPKEIRTFNLNLIWEKLKKEHPGADALINFTFTPLKHDLAYPIYCGDIAEKKS